MKKPLRILHVEDSERDVTLLSRHLEKSGYQLVSERVETADDMNAALAASEWDIILCNYSMPRFDALSALNVLRKSGLDLPFLIISETIGEDVAVKALLNGAHDYILKNDLTRLKPSIERELLQAEERRAKRKAEDALKASEAELRALFAAMNDIVIVFDHDGRHLKVAPTNPKFLFKHGTNRIGKTVHEIYPPDFAHFLLTNIQTCLDESRTLNLEYSLSIDGNDRWFNGTVTPVTDDSVVWVARDNTDRKRAEEALRESNEKFHQLANNLTDVFWIRSRDMSKIHYISPAYEKIWGRSLRNDYADPQEWQGYIVPDDQQRVKDAYASLMDDAPNIEVEFRIVRPDDEIRWVRARGFQVRDIEGNIIRLAGIVTDITESRHTNEALAESEKRFRSVVETAPDVIVTIDDENRIFFINPAAEKTFGYTVDEIRGASLTMLMPERLRHMHEAGFQRYLESGVKHVSWNLVEASGLHKGGREIPITISFSEYVQDGRRYFTGIIRDISDRKKAMEALQKSEERYRELVENALDIIYTHDLKGNYTSANKAAEVITGYTNAEVLALNMADTINPGQFEKAKKMIAAKLAGENITAYELELIAKDGHTIPVEVNTRLVYENGVAVGIQGIARDITARKLLEEQLRQSQKMEAVGVMAGGIAHDFNNLLTAINGYSDLTLSSMSPDDPLRRNIEQVQRAGERAAELTSQLLAFSRKQVLKPVVHNLNSVIETIEKMLRRIIRENIELRTVLDADLGNIIADPGQVEQVIMNLALNARDAMPDGGTLTIETQNVYLDHKYISHKLAIEPGPFVRMTVSDTGTGIDVITQQHIFEPFFTTKEVGKGTGLGLSMVYGIVKQSGGDVLVYSEPGHGTTFKVYLPRVDKTIEKQKGIGDRIARHVGTETVLLVEDEEVVRNLVRKILTVNGYNVLEASSGDAALEICKSHSGPIHLLLTDVIMPKMGGREVKEEVVKLHPDIKVLFMSGYTDDAISHGGIFDSATEFIEKPFTPDRLIDKVRGVLEQ